MAKMFAGVDEAGRGCLCGPVVAAAVVLPETHDDPLFTQIRDSKKVSAKKREILAEYIKRIAVTYGIGMADHLEIDRVNILHATMNAMHRALDIAYRKCPFEAIKIDGNRFAPYMPPGADAEPLEMECIVGGDDSNRSIAAASILAKVTRDHWIDEIVREHPEYDIRYGWGKNKGYGTAQHMNGLTEHGPAPCHRYSYAPVSAARAAHEPDEPHGI